MNKTRPTASKLAQWTEKINYTAAKDPLGLTNRVSQRLISQLLFGITAIGNRARYYSYSLWSIYDVMKREKPRNYKDLCDGVYWRDNVFATSCLLHHASDDYKIDGVIGKNEGTAYLRKAGQRLDLANVKHIASNPEGGFGLNYRGSLLNLGFFRQIYADDTELNVVYEVSDQPAIKKMIALLDSHICDTDFYKKYACHRNPIPRGVLEDFGKKVCVCLLHKPDAPEKNVLRDILFERYDGY